LSHQDPWVFQRFFRFTFSLQPIWSHPKSSVFFLGWTEGIYIEGWANLYECAKPDPAVALEYGWGITQDDPGEQEMNIDDFWLRFGNILPISVNQNWSIQYMIQ
jgi:hypothetical protein